MFEKIKDFAFSLKTGIILMALMALYAIFESTLGQATNPSSYSTLLQFFGIYNGYKSWFFILLLVLFSINLMGCTVKSLSGHVRQFRSKKPIKRGKKEILPLDDDRSNRLKDYLKRHHYHFNDNDCASIAYRDRIGILGIIVTHGAVFLFILAGLLSSLTSIEGSLAFRPGDQRSLDFTDHLFVMDNFEVSYDEDGALFQYKTYLTVEKDGKEENVVVSVNNPYVDGPFQLHAASYGWLNYLLVESLEGESLLNAELLNQEAAYYEDKDLSIFLYGYFPDYYLDESGEPRSYSEQESNPKYVIALYENDQQIGVYTLSLARLLFMMIYN